MYAYKERIVIFIDILGYKKIVGNTVNPDGSDNADGLKLVESIHKIIDYFLEPDEDEKVEADIQISKFSDCIVISFDHTSQSQIFYRVIALQWLLINLIFKGILCRGGIAIGKVFHTHAAIFGPALVNAYLLESKAAIYPRIIVSRDIVNLAGDYCRDGHSHSEEVAYVRGILAKDTDGMYYVDYFASAQSELNDPELDFPEYLSSLYHIISKGIKYKDISVRMKYMWMMEKYNPLIKNIHLRIKKGLYNPSDAEIKQMYLNLPLVI
ncbi:MAG: hypothetical protein KKA55_08065 [Proteobacteria bacterium]|nr:hypothetical protein [Pseudomonadota bacterium]MBU1595472.1 hypothetical protein [Pseudomonadota bacterium]